MFEEKCEFCDKKIKAETKKELEEKIEEHNRKCDKQVKVYG